MREGEPQVVCDVCSEQTAQYAACRKWGGSTVSHTVETAAFHQARQVGCKLARCPYLIWTCLAVQFQC